MNEPLCYVVMRNGHIMPPGIHMHLVNAEATAAKEEGEVVPLCRWQSSQSPHDDAGAVDAEEIAGIVTQIETLRGDRQADWYVCKELEAISMRVAALRRHTHAPQTARIAAESAGNYVPLEKDDAEQVIWQAIQNITIGNKTDDKLILSELRKLGCWIYQEKK